MIVAKQENRQQPSQHETMPEQQQKRAVPPQRGVRHGVTLKLRPKTKVAFFRIKQGFGWNNSGSSYKWIRSGRDR